MPATKPTIAVVSDSVLPFNSGGKETRIQFLTQELARSGHDVHIYTMRWWGQGNSTVIDGVTYHALCRAYPLYAGDRRSIKQGLLFGLAGLKLLTARFDVIEVDHMPYFPLYTAKLVSLVRRKPLHATWHEVWGRDYWREYLGRLGLLAYWVEKLSVRLPDHIITVSALTGEQLGQVLGYGGKLSVITNGIDYEAISRIKPSKQTSDIIFVGRLLAHKHVDVLVQAVAQLKLTRPNIRCLIVGTGPESDRIARLITELGLSQNVTMTGRLDDSNQVFSLMKAARVFVLPSTREGFGITVLEAFACGLPVVTIDHPANAAASLVSDQTGVVCGLSSDAIAQACQSLLKRSRTGTTATAAEYSWSKLAQQLVGVYSQ